MSSLALVADAFKVHGMRACINGLEALPLNMKLWLREMSFLMPFLFYMSSKHDMTGEKQWQSKNRGNNPEEHRKNRRVRPVQKESHHRGPSRDNNKGHRRPVRDAAQRRDCAGIQKRPGAEAIAGKTVRQRNRRADKAENTGRGERFGDKGKQAGCSCASRILILRR